MEKGKSYGASPAQALQRDGFFKDLDELYKIDLSPIAEATIRGAAATIAEWTEPRLFLMAMERMRELNPTWWRDTHHLPMAEAIRMLTLRYPIHANAVREQSAPAATVTSAAGLQDLADLGRLQRREAQLLRGSPEQPGNENLDSPTDAELDSAGRSRDVPSGES